MIGKYGAKLDEKHRLIVPAKLREELGSQFYVTIGINCGYRCLTLYTAAEWDRICENYNSLTIPKRGGAMSLFFMNAAECVPDKQFRFSLTGFLEKYAGIRRDVLIVGRAGQAEIWDVEEFEKFEEENSTPEMLLKSLEDIGL